MSFSRNENQNSNKRFCVLETDERVHRNYVEILDFMEGKVEALREKASGIEMERESLISTLGRLKTHKDLKHFSEGQKEEVEATAQRLMNRMLTVEVKVITTRNEVQKKALTKLNKIVDDLLITVKSDPKNSKKILEPFFNACVSESVGPVNIKFQTLLLDCTADDQKRVRKRLESIMDLTYPSSLLMDVN